MISGHNQKSENFETIQEKFNHLQQGCATIITEGKVFFKESVRDPV